MFAGLVREESRFVLLSGPEAQCNDYHLTANLSYVDICNFINSTADCQSDDGFINYLNLIYCSLAGGFEMSLFSGAVETGYNVLFTSITNIIAAPFLVADTQLYKSLCPSVRRSVRPSIRP